MGLMDSDRCCRFVRWMGTGRGQLYPHRDRATVQPPCDTGGYECASIFRALKRRGWHSRVTSAGPAAAMDKRPAKPPMSARPHVWLDQTGANHG
jgi:hypothetical protein